MLLMGITNHCRSVWKPVQDMAMNFLLIKGGVIMGWTQKFKDWCKPDKREKGFIIGDLERDRFRRLFSRNDALNKQIKTTQETWLGIRTGINTDLQKFWDDIFKFYGLRKDKNYSLNQDTGEISEVDITPKVVPVAAKGDKKNG